MPENENEKEYLGSTMEPPKEVAACEHRYAELDVTTHYSFLRGASFPSDLVYTAANLGYHAMAITDRNSLAGVVRAFEAAKKVAGFCLIVGVRLVFVDGTPDLLAWPGDCDAYARLCRLLTRGKRAASKGECHLTLADFLEHNDGIYASLDAAPSSSLSMIDTLQDAMGDRLSLSFSVSLDGNDRARFDGMLGLSRKTAVRLLATNHVHYHDAACRRLQDVMTCIRHGCTIQEAGYRLFPNAERYMKRPEKMHRLFAEHPSAIRRGIEIAERCRQFKLSDVPYGYPTEPVPKGMTPTRFLKRLTYGKARERYPQGIPNKVRKLLKKELKFICGSKYESYFITVYDLVRFARSKKILCQGRGSAANSAVCYCLGVTAVDPMVFQLVFERFASSARGEPPDIDIDFEHERREEVIQYVYNKYGRDYAAMTASLTTYHARSAIRDVGKALGLSQDLLEVLSGKMDWWHKGSLSPEQLAEANLGENDPVIQQLVDLTTQLLKFPRHLSQHVGGMVISRTPLCDIVPIENAAMEDRTVIEWDKDDLEILGLFKVDILALGMLTCLAKAMKLVDTYTPGPPLALHTMPAKDKPTYEMISRADTIGVFQVESRAQMSMLPRLRPSKFYDLVIEVAIVRPGPIQGNMVHPYLRERERERREGEKFKINYPKPELAEVLKDTLGVPLFQEQAMRLAIVAAKFTAQEADDLRRSMAAWKRSAGLGHFYDKFINGMVNNDYPREFAEQCFEQLKGFGSYGFPESHAASFAKLVYASAWLKCHHPAAFCAALLNSQPMGFYAPAQLVRDAREHHVEVRPIDINASDWDCTLEPIDSIPHWPAVRLGLRQIKGLSQAEADRATAARQRFGPFTTMAQLQSRAAIPASTIRRLAAADAFVSLEQPRRSAEWQAMALSDQCTDVLDEQEPPAELLPQIVPAMKSIDEVLTDYSTTGLSLKSHPVAFVRNQLTRQSVIPAAALRDAKRFPHGRHIKVAGLVLVRQRPGTASGIVFITLEDETGVANLVLWSTIYDHYRRAARYATLMQVAGQVQREGEVVHILVRRVWDRSDLLRQVSQPARNFH